MDGNYLFTSAPTTTYSYTHIFYYLFAKFSRKINRKVKITNNNIVMKSKIWKILLIIACVVVLFGVLGSVIFVESVKSNPNYAQFDNEKLNKVYSNLTVLDDDGNLLNEATYYKNIKQVPLSTLPKYAYMSFVAVEDKRFFSHDGIDVRRVGGALLHNLQSQSLKEGASTITQQLIKNTHLDNQKTIERKVNEMVLAVELEKHYSKMQILEMYLNTIYFGRNAYGIENAANVYFNKSAKELSVSESAVLAGMIKAPNLYAPDKNMQKCKSRRDVVLQLMLEQNVITDTQYTEAKNADIVYDTKKNVAEKTYMYYVLKEACSLLNMTECQLLNSNYVIETYCDQNVQQSLCQLAQKDVTMDKNGNLCDLACVLLNNDGAIVACYMRGENADCKGQVGSTLKPIAVYTPALNEKIITQASSILDEPTNFNGYNPQNASGKYCGWTTIKQSVTKSLNIPAVKTLNALTLPTAEKYLQKMGINGEQNLSLALGNVVGGLTPLELAKCYMALSNNGAVCQPRFVKAIKSSKGTIYTAKNKPMQVFSPTSTFLMTDMLLDAVNNGTAKALKKDYQVAAKTGTVGNKTGNTDALVAGYTTKNTFVVWHKGSFDNDVNGSTAPCTLASKMLDNIYKNTAPKDFIAPKGAVKITIDRSSLKQQQLKIAKNGMDFWFDVANRPTEKVEEITYNYTIDCKQTESGTLLTLPSITNGSWQLFKIVDGKQTNLPLQNNNSYLCCDDVATTYIAKLYVDGQLVYQTPPTEVFPIIIDDKDAPNDVPTPPNHGILDFWYWK